MCEDTKLKAIHNKMYMFHFLEELSSMCEDTKLKAIHNSYQILQQYPFVVFNVRRY